MITIRSVSTEKCTSVLLVVIQKKNTLVIMNKFGHWSPSSCTYGSWSTLKPCRSLVRLYYHAEAALCDCAYGQQQFTSVY